MTMPIRDSIMAVLTPAFLLAACSGLPSAGDGTSGPRWDGKTLGRSNVHCKANQDICTVAVDYDDPHDTDLDCGNYCFAVVKEFVVVAPKSGNTQYVEWNLRGGGQASFVDGKGIVFKDANAPFTNCGRGKVKGGGDVKKSYHCTNDHPSTASWKYTINLELDDNYGAIQPTDPWVVNK